MPLPLPQRSLARQIIIKMGISIAAVIILIVVISYLYLSSGLKSQMLEQLEKYISERGKRESSIFMLAEDNHAILKKELLQQLNSLGDQDPQTEFEQLFVRWDDGVIRNQAEGFDGTRQVGVYIDKTLSIDADVRRRVLTFYDLIGKYGPAWHNRFQDTYITTPENIIVIYWPEYPTWAQDASADLYMPDEEYVWVADKKHNPSRLTSWTGVFYDKVSRLWMVSIETPVDIADRHIATVGHDIILNELLDRTIEDHLEGAYNLILRADGRLIAHPDKISDIQEQAGDFDILKSDDQHLIRIFESVKNIEPGQLVVENTADNEYLAVTKIEGPDWYFVTVYPKSLLSELPLKTIRFILILGIILLLIEAIVVFFILHKQVAQPLKQLSRVTRQLPQGELMESKDEKLISRQDEIGEIGGAVYTLTSYFKAVLEDFVQVSQGLAAGNLQVTPQAEYKGEFVQIKNALDIALSNQRKVIEDIVQMSQGLATGEHSVTAKAEYRGDFVQIKNALETASIKNVGQHWLKTGQTQLNEVMSGEQEIETLAKNIISFLIPYVEAQVGLFYLLKEGDKPYLQIIASYAYSDKHSERFQIGEGLVGQAAMEQKTLFRTYTPEEYQLIIQSGFATAVLRQVLFVPFLYEKAVKGVIEIGFSEETMTSIQREFLEHVMPSIGIAVNTAESRWSPR